MTGKNKGLLFLVWYRQYEYNLVRLDILPYWCFL